MLISKIIEVETGYTTNEPVQMAVTEGLKSVHTSSGDKGGIWEADASPEAYDGFSQL
jgi:curli production assembly/transport component CsgG